MQEKYCVNSYYCFNYPLQIVLHRLLHNRLCTMTLLHLLHLLHLTLLHFQQQKKLSNFFEIFQPEESQKKLTLHCTHNPIDLCTGFFFSSQNCLGFISIIQYILYYCTEQEGRFLLTRFPHHQLHNNYKKVRSKLSIIDLTLRLLLIS